MKKPCASVDHVHEISEGKKHAALFLTFGILLMLLGCGAIYFSSFTTLVSVIFLGIVLVSSGLAYLFHTSWVYEWKGVFLSIFLAALSIVTGLLCIFSPALSSSALTLLIGSYFFVSGIVRMTSALILQFYKWGAYFFNGLVSLILGVLIFLSWPESSLWVIGVFVGIDIFLAGLMWVYISRLLARKTQQL